MGSIVNEISLKYFKEYSYPFKVSAVICSNKGTRCLETTEKILPIDQKCILRPFSGVGHLCGIEAEPELKF